jgi:hypothetical protein
MRKTAKERRYEQAMGMLISAYLILDHADEFARYVSEISDTYIKAVGEMQRGQNSDDSRHPGGILDSAEASNLT